MCGRPLLVAAEDVVRENLGNRRFGAHAEHDQQERCPAHADVALDLLVCARSFGERKSMPMQQYELGDMVWSQVDLHNDGTIPEMDQDAQLASAGARGVVVKVGSLEHQPEVSVYLVRFEDAAGVLGPPIGCLGDELTQDQAFADALANREATEQPQP
jgi:nitrogen fixation protein NifZ